MLFFFLISSVKYSIKYLTFEKLKDYMCLDLEFEPLLVVFYAEKTGKLFLSKSEPAEAVFF